MSSLLGVESFGSLQLQYLSMTSLCIKGHNYGDFSSAQRVLDQAIVREGDSFIESNWNTSTAVWEKRVYFVTLIDKYSLNIIALSVEQKDIVWGFEIFDATQNGNLSLIERANNRSCCRRAIRGDVISRDELPGLLHLFAHGFE